ncbi:MAG: hypothetical protein P8Y51_08415 [Campylobacterales bacterium]|jgi:hypothetical protein
MQKIESFAKIITAIAALAGSILIPWVLHINAQNNQKSQVYADIMSQREQSDTSIRSEMFKTLIQTYLGKTDLTGSGPDTPERLEEQLVLLALLTKNFQEFFDAKPLFEDLYRKLSRRDDPRSMQLKEELIDLAGSTASKQAVQLASIGGFEEEVGLTVGGTYCIRLYNVDEVKNIPISSHGSCSTVPDASIPQNEACDREWSRKSKYHSIELTVEALKENAARVHLIVYEDLFGGREPAYCSSRIGKEVSFDVSYFDMPFMDNTRLYDGSRFSIMLKELEPASNTAGLEVISFKEEFMSLRDRPYFEQMLKSIQK